MSAFKIDGDFTVASATAKPAFSNPFGEVNIGYVLRQPFMQLLADFEELDLNEPHPDYPTFFLCEESERTPIGAGLVTWERTYAQVPAAFDQFETTNYNFIGYYGNVLAINVTAATGRLRFVKSVTSRIHNEFFMVGTGLTYETPDEIPTVEAQKYYYDQPTILTDYLGDDDILDVATTPSRTEYEAMISAGDEIVSEDSRLTHWLGNIWLRQTRYVKAQ